MNAILSKLILTVARRRMRRIAEWKRDPVTAQERLLKKLVRYAATTRFGREHGFDSIRSIKDYQERTPLREYGEFTPYWDRLFNGESDVVWPGRIRHFALSSGTTAPSKRTPFSRQGLRSYSRAGADILKRYISLTGDTGVLDGQSLFLCDSPRHESRPHNIQVGDATGLMRQQLPWFMNRARIPSRRVAAMRNWEEKLDAVAAEAWKADIRRITANPLWLLCIADRVLRLSREAGRKAETLADVWPNLSLYGHFAACFTPYRAMFKKLFGRPVHMLDVYAGSEGFIALQDTLDNPDLLLILDSGIFYEFVPTEELRGTRPSRFSVADVEKGVDYAIVLTTNNGLWSYILGDTVRFTSLRPHKLLFTGRTQQFISIGGEELVLEQVERAMSDACDTSGEEILDFHVAPLYPTDEDHRPRHQWFVEFRKPAENLERFCALLDQALKRHSIRYEQKREGDQGFQSPELVVLPRGTLLEALRRSVRLGSQTKVPRLSNDRKFADLLLQIAPQGR